VGDLHVTVRYHGSVVDDRVLPVRGEVRIGDGRRARVPFPGADLSVVRVGDDLELKGRRLRPGQRTGFSLGPIHVQVEHVEPLRVPRLPGAQFDFRFLLVALAVTAGGMWLDTLSAIAEDPEAGPVARRVVELGESLGFGGALEASDGDSRTAAVQPNGDLSLFPPDPAFMADGPPAVSDDEVTGWNYLSWYRALASRSAPIITSYGPAPFVGAGERGGPDWDSALSSRARAAYHADRWDDAHQLYQILTKSYPAELEWQVGLASARKRLGRHRAELSTWDRILEHEPDHFEALGNRATALARLGRWDEVPAALAAMHRARPDHPFGHVYEATCAALQGREDDAIGHLEIAVARRGALSDDGQIELRRDLALEPAFASLRAGRRLRAMLSRQLGAASPRPRR